MPLWLFTHTTLYLHTVLYLLPIKFVPMTVHSYNFLFAHTLVRSPYQICPYHNSHIEHSFCTQFCKIEFAPLTIHSYNFFIGTQVCTFSLSNLPPSQFSHKTFYLHLILYFFPIKFALWLFTHATLYLHTILYLLPIKFVPMTVHSYNFTFAHKFVPSPSYQICPYHNSLIQHSVCTQ